MHLHYYGTGAVLSCTRDGRCTSMDVSSTSTPNIDLWNISIVSSGLCPCWHSAMGSHPRCIYITTPYPTSQERSIIMQMQIHWVNCHCSWSTREDCNACMERQYYSCILWKNHQSLKPWSSSGLTEILYYLMLGSICWHTIVKPGIYIQEELQPYLKRRDELSIQDCFLLWGNRMHDHS